MAFIALVSPVYTECQEGKKNVLKLQATRPQVIVSSLRDNLRFHSGFLRWITLYVVDRFAATLYMLKVRGCACGVINIEKKLTTAASVDRVYVSGDIERLNTSCSPQRVRQKRHTSYTM